MANSIMTVFVGLAGTVIDAVWDTPTIFTVVRQEANSFAECVIFAGSEAHYFLGRRDVGTGEVHTSSTFLRTHLCIPTVVIGLTKVCAKAGAVV